MPVKYKIDVLRELKIAGYNTNIMRKEKILGESVIQQIRTGKPVSWRNVERICALLDCQPGDLFEYDFSVKDLPDSVTRCDAQPGFVCPIKNYQFGDLDADTLAGECPIGKYEPITKHPECWPELPEGCSRYINDWCYYLDRDDGEA